MGDLAVPGDSRDATGAVWAPFTSASATAVQAKAKRQALKLRLAEEKGFRLALEDYIPGVIQRMEKRQETMDLVGVSLDEAIRSKDWDAVKALQKVTKDSNDEDKRLLDRFYGTSVARSQSEVTQTVTHVSLRDVVAGQPFVLADAGDVTDVEAIDDAD